MPAEAHAGAKPAPSSAAPGVRGRAKETRAAILDHAERLFAERGYDKARLEDVAAAVGIKRASIVYYYRDKREVYDAVLSEVFGGFRAQLEDALVQDKEVLECLESAIGSWVDYIAERPTFARLLLREIADGPNQETSPVGPHIEPFFSIIETFMVKHGEALEPFESLDPAHIASTIAGATIFFVAGLPVLAKGSGVDPLAAESLASHRKDVLRLARQLLTPETAAS